MAAGHALDDADRWDWLVSLREAAVKALNDTNTNTNAGAPSGAIVACSALKRKYRDVIRGAAAYHTSSIKVHFIYLKLGKEALLQRVNQRQEHYMKSGMVKSQLETLEEPWDEFDSVTIDVGKSREEVQAEVSRSVEENLKEN